MSDPEREHVEKVMLMALQIATREMSTEDLKEFVVRLVDELKTRRELKKKRKNYVE